MMSFWSRVVDSLRHLTQSDREKPDILAQLRSADRQVAFTIALISLGAKMAKADGTVTVDEIRAFKAVFPFRPDDEKKVAKVFNHAKETVAGFEHYAAEIAKHYQHDKRVRDDVMEGLFQIASMGGGITPEERDFLCRVSEIFGLSERRLNQRLHRFGVGEAGNPYTVLGVSPSDSIGIIRKRWKQLIRESHPDILIARGAPPEAARLAQERVADYNQAFDTIKKMRGSGS